MQAQALKLLGRIAQAHSPDELWRAADCAEGFVLGLETVKALNARSKGTVSGVRKRSHGAAPGA